MSNPKVAVLGCGPSGLVAAHAATLSGADVAIYSRKRKSELYGCQYLHEPIKFITNKRDFVPVKYTFKGTPEDYKRKVYGDRHMPLKVSPEYLPEQHYAWDIRDTYDRLWETYKSQITNYTPITPMYLGNLLFRKWHRIYSTIPLPAICKDASHKFEGVQVRANGDAPERGHFVPASLRAYGDNIIVCDGSRQNPWYRYSRVFGHSTVEWPEACQSTGAYSTLIRKPLANTCNCWEDTPLVKVGRYGAWRKGILVHQVYTEVMLDMAGVR